MSPLSSTPWLHCPELTLPSGGDILPGAHSQYMSLSAWALRPQVPPWACCAFYPGEACPFLLPSDSLDEPWSTSPILQMRNWSLERGKTCQRSLETRVELLRYYVPPFPLAGCHAAPLNCWVFPLHPNNSLILSQTTRLGGRSNPGHIPILEFSCISLLKVFVCLFLFCTGLPYNSF